MTITSGKPIGEAGSDADDSRRMCFGQGKAFVYQPEDQQDTIVTEWPNGVIDRHDLKAKQRSRRWPDGTTETRDEDDPVDYPTWPQPATLPAPATASSTSTAQARAAGRPMPKLTIVIGANGAGKSTWCDRHRDELPANFYDADSIAKGLGDWNSADKQRQAREVVDKAVEEHLTARTHFGFESTYSGSSRPRIVRRAKAAGYEVAAIFLGTTRPEINIDRVKARVAAGTGHDVPESEIRRRWTAAQENLVDTCHAIDVIELIDNSGRTRRPQRLREEQHAAAAADGPRWAVEMQARIEERERR